MERKKNLCLTRKPTEQITLDVRGEIITITVLRGKCRLAFEASREVQITRSELFDERTELEVPA